MMRASLVRRLAAALLLLVAGLASAPADTVVLKNGNRLTGRILEEDEKVLRVDLGDSVLTIRKDTVATVERGLAVEMILKKARTGNEAARRALAAKDAPEGLRIAEEALEDLAFEFGRVEGTPPAELVEMREILEATRRACLPPDPQSQRAEELFQKARKALEFVNTADAYKALKEAAELDGSRLDVLVLLAEVSRRQNDTVTSLSSYRKVLKADSGTYYDRVSKPLLELLEAQGRRLLADRRADAAVEIYADILLLRGERPGEPVKAEDFLGRRTARAAQNEEQTLMEVYKYADDEDLVDLAFASLTKIEKVNPNLPGLKQKLAETGFLSEFQRAVASGDLNAPAQLLNEADPSLLAEPKVAELVEKFAGELGPDVRAQSLFLKAREAYDAGRYEEAAEQAREVIVDFPLEPAASPATELLTLAQSEIPLRDAAAKAEALVKDAKDAEAEALLLEAKGASENFEKTVQGKRIDALLAAIPLQKKADELWQLAAADIDREEYEPAFKRLEELESRYAGTRAGKRAAAYLQQYRFKLQRQTTLYRPPETDYFVPITDPNFWRGRAFLEGENPSTMKAPPVVQEARPAAMKLFDETMAVDVADEVETRPAFLYVLLPLLLGGGVLVGVLWTLARPGRGHLREAEEVHAENAGEVLNPSGVVRAQGRCRDCGLKLFPEDLACRHCGESVALTGDEEIRAQDGARRAAFDPWELRVKTADLNQFEKYYQEARDLTETSDIQAALNACRLALREDPRSVRGYTLMAAIYERLGQTEQAVICYRELLLLDPSDSIVRQKLESSMKTPPLHLGIVAPLLAAGVWWVVFWLTLGLDPHAVVLRAALCVAGAVLTWQLFERRQRRAILEVAGTDIKTIVEMQRPLPSEVLTWKEQNRQARFLADAIRAHTGMEVPPLTLWNLFFALVASTLLLGGLVAVAWLNHAPWALLAWPAGAALFVYLFEFFPRLYTAHVLLRHMQEETLSPWVDPHRPFRPKGVQPEPVGEFLLRDVSRLPLGWAFSPRPYAATRQGLLNSIQQTLNRHWAFHSFYEKAHIVRDLQVPIPVGHRTSSVLMVLLMLVAVATPVWFAARATARGAEYREAMVLGYRYMMEGDLESSMGYLREARRLRPARFAPPLFLAHAQAQARNARGAERSFLEAVRKDAAGGSAANDYGNFLQRQGRLREALEQYRAALAKAPENSNILNNAGSACFKLKQYGEAVEYLRKATTIEPTHPRAWTTLGLCLEAQGGRAQARAAYEQAVRVAPDVPYTRVAKDRLAADLAPDEAAELRLSKDAL